MPAVEPAPETWADISKGKAMFRTPVSSEALIDIWKKNGSDSGNKHTAVKEDTDEIIQEIQIKSWLYGNMCVWVYTYIIYTYIHRINNGLSLICF